MKDLTRFTTRKRSFIRVMKDQTRLATRKKSFIRVMKAKTGVATRKKSFIRAMKDVHNPKPYFAHTFKEVYEKKQFTRISWK